MTVSSAPKQIEKAYVIGRGFSVGLGEDLEPKKQALIDQIQDFIPDSPFPAVSRSAYDELKVFIQHVFPNQQTDGANPLDEIGLFSLLEAAQELKALNILPFLGYTDPRNLLDKLRAIFSQMLHWRLRERSVHGKAIDGKFFRAIEPGTIFLSLNWDNFLECGLIKAERDVLLERYDPQCVSVFKLHGSIDWILREEGMSLPSSDYQPRSLPIKHDPVSRKTEGEIEARIKNARLMSIEDPQRAWERLHERSLAPIMFTMGYGKTRGMAEWPRFRKIWQPAACTLARAKKITIIGYSMPRDDLEVRLLLREAICLHKERYGDLPSIENVNPCKTARDRFREAVGREAVSPDCKSDTGRFQPDMVL
jgi:hypothetical protein